MMGTTEVIVIVGVVLILFGARAIPKFARSVGQAKREFEAGVREGEDKNREKIEQQDPGDSNSKPPKEE